MTTLSQMVNERFNAAIDKRRALAINEGTKFYHGTQKRNLPKIWKEGLKPTAFGDHRANYDISDTHSIYLSTDLDEARNWGRYNAKIDDGWVVLEIPREVIMENFDNFHEDNNLRCCPEFWRLEDVEIKPELLKIVESGNIS